MWHPVGTTHLNDTFARNLSCAVVTIRCAAHLDICSLPSCQEACGGGSSVIRYGDRWRWPRCGGSSRSSATRQWMPEASRMPSSMAPNWISSPSTRKSPLVVASRDPLTRRFKLSLNGAAALAPTVEALQIYRRCSSHPFCCLVFRQYEVEATSRMPEAGCSTCDKKS